MHKCIEFFLVIYLILMDIFIHEQRSKKIMKIQAQIHTLA